VPRFTSFRLLDLTNILLEVLPLLLCMRQTLNARDDAADAGHLSRLGAFLMHMLPSHLVFGFVPRGLILSGRGAQIVQRTNNRPNLFTAVFCIKLSSHFQLVRKPHVRNINAIRIRYRLSK
jgi:hypothetical protein